MDTYIIFTFTCGELQWSGRDSEYSVVGYNSRGDFFSNNIANGYENIADSVSCSVQVVNSKQRRSTHAIINNHVEKLEADGELAKQLRKCNEYILTDRTTYPGLNLIIKNLPQCPLSNNQVRKDLLFQYDTMKTGSTCYRSKVTYTTQSSLLGGVFVQQCCYNR